MSVISWITPRGDLGTVSENNFYSYQLEAIDSDEQPLFYSYVSGELPGGMSITRDGQLRGIPAILSSVNQTIASTFTVRATNPNGNVSDRSFSLTISNINGPQILPKPDLIGAWFDGSFLDYTFQAVNDNPNSIQTWKLIDGDIPPGTTFTSQGRLFGYVDIIASNTDDLGFEAAPVESVVFDALPKSADKFYNFTVQVSDDLKIDSINVRLLVVSKGNFSADNDITEINNTFITVDTDNNYYPIILNNPESLPVLVSGSTFAYKFLAYDPEDEIVSWSIDELDSSGMDELDAAVSQTLIGNGAITTYTMDQTPINASRIVLQVNEVLYTSYVNYTTVSDQLIFFPNTISLSSATTTANVATLTFATQPDIVFPVGSTITVANVAGETSYNGNFVVTSSSINSVSYSLPTVAEGNISSANVSLKLPDALDTIFIQFISTTTGYDSILFDQGLTGPPAGITIDVNTGWAIGTLPSQTEEFKTYEFDVQAYRRFAPLLKSDKVRFKLTVKRTLNEEIIWTSPTDLGSLDNGDVSEISVSAYNTLGKPIEYSLIYAPFKKLPQGLRFLRNGTLIGRTSFRYFALDGQSAILNITSTEDLAVGMLVQGSGVAEGCKITAIIDANTIEVRPAIYVVQGTILIFSNDDIQKAVSTTSNSISTLIDSGRTTFDQQCGFTVVARSTDGSVESTKSFSLRVRPRNLAPFENVYLRALPSYSQRLSWNEAANDTTIFPPELIFRPDDSYFGVQKSFKSLFLSGLNPGTAEAFVSAIERNHYLKEINFGEIKTARAVNSDGTVGYEVVYVDLVDSQSIGENSAPLEVVLNVANKFLFNNQSYNVIYPNSFLNMQKRLENGKGYTNRSTLPKWMTSVQEDGKVLGLIRCVVLAYTIPGASKSIAYRLQQSNFDIKEITFVADRYQWDNYLSQFYNTETNSFEPSIPTTFDKYPSLATGSSIVPTTIVNSVTNNNVITVPNNIRVGYGWEVLSEDALLDIPNLTKIGNINTFGNILTLTSNITANAGSLIKIRGEAFVDYAVSKPFNSINGENLNTVRSLLLIDGVPNFSEGEKIIFAKQYGFNVPTDGWVDTNGNYIPGYLDKSGGLSNINYQAGVWELTWEEFPEFGLDSDQLGFDEISENLNFSHFDQGGDAEVQLIFNLEIILNQTVKVRTGDTYKVSTLQYKTIQGEALPGYVTQSTATGVERTAETTFDGGTCVVREGFEPGKSITGGTTFSNNIDIWIVPESKDKYIKFPQNGVFV